MSEAVGDFVQVSDILLVKRDLIRLECWNLVDRVFGVDQASNGPCFHSVGREKLYCGLLVQSVKYKLRKDNASGGLLVLVAKRIKKTG